MPSFFCRRSVFLAASALAVGVAAAALFPLPSAQADHHAEAAPTVAGAVAILQATAGEHSTHGEIRFAPTAKGIHITGKVHGLTPNAHHGFHVHEFGDISAPDGTGTGGHFNPGGHDHALPGEHAERHAGDLGNIVADADGVGTFDLTVEGISLEPGVDCILGRGLIVHAGKDDGGQPTGNAGARIAQGVIGIASAKSMKP